MVYTLRFFFFFKFSLFHNSNAFGSCIIHILYTECVDKKNQLDVTFVFFISLLIIAQHVSGNHVPIIRS